MKIRLTHPNQLSFSWGMAWVSLATTNVNNKGPTALVGHIQNFHHRLEALCLGISLLYSVEPCTVLSRYELPNVDDHCRLSSLFRVGSPAGVPAGSNSQVMSLFKDLHPALLQSFDSPTSQSSASIQAVNLIFPLSTCRVLGGDLGQPELALVI